MKRWLQLWLSPIVCSLASAANVLLAVVGHTPLRFFNAATAVFALGVAIFGIYVARRIKRTDKEIARLDGLLKEVQQPSSPSHQPTSGKSPSPAPSPSPSFRNGGIVPVPSRISLSAYLNEPPSSSRPKPETRLTPVVGFRSWLLDETFKIGLGHTRHLASLNPEYGGLKPGPNKARCLRGVSFAHSGRAPELDCLCGFYVMNSLEAVPFDQALKRTFARGPYSPPLELGPFVVGAVVGWGKVIQHADEGWRAEFIQVIALLDCKVSDEHLRLTREAAEAYGVPVVGRRGLELLAKEYGEQLPVEARA